MLTNIRIKNFKRFADVSFELGERVVLIGPNNSGKTTALQALSLWELGLRRWNEKRGERMGAVQRAGVALNRNDLLAIPVPNTGLLWRDLRAQTEERADGRRSSRKRRSIRIEIIVEGITNDRRWACGLEFDHTNEESLYVRPLRLNDGPQPQRLEVPSEATALRVAFLPPMSGLAAVEPKLELGRVNVLLGEGQTAQVLRNLCYQIYTQTVQSPWHSLTRSIRQLFGADLLAPQYLVERGEIRMSYRERGGVELDLSSAGRGLQQTLLLLAHLYVNPHSVLLLDEPDAHLEVLRQRQMYQLLSDIAAQQGSQIIAASHSEVVLNEAADRDLVIAFVGQPHRIDDRGSQVLKSLKEIGFEHYYQAEQTGWVLYLEGSTDLAILQAFAQILKHPASEHLERPFVHYVANQPPKARDHFYGLREACPALVGIAIFDRLEKELPSGGALRETMWQSRELENYLCQEAILLAYARHQLPDDLFGQAEAEQREQTMRETIAEISQALQLLRRLAPWSPEVKVTDEFLDPLFARYFEKLKLPNLLRKTDYHVLTQFLEPDQIDQEIVEKLDLIVEVASQATPRTN
jgi:ABC-type transport system involved in cytochrome c biogenesis ATPase subunit